MGQRKGYTGNPQGKPKGAKNKITRSLKESITAFCELNFNKAIEIWDNMEGDDKKLKFYTELLQYVLPKEKQLNFSNLSENELDLLINSLKSKINE